MEEKEKKDHLIADPLGNEICAADAQKRGAIGIVAAGPNTLFEEARNAFRVNGVIKSSSGSFVCR